MSARRRQLVLSASARQDLNEIEHGSDTLSLADLPFVTPEDMQHARFPFSAADDVSTDQGRELEAIMARGAPEWVRALRRRFEA